MLHLVRNNGPQIGSHYHFIETNPRLSFDRARSYGKRLDIPAGTAVRFEPGDTKTVTLCAIAGNKIITGGNKLGTGVVNSWRTEEIVTGLVQKGFGHIPEPGVLEINEDTTIGRDAYVSMYGPTVGDKVRLGDTLLWIEVERDETVYGDEVKFGGGSLKALAGCRIVDRRTRKNYPRGYGSSHKQVFRRNVGPRHHECTHRRLVRDLQGILPSAPFHAKSFTEGSHRQISASKMVTLPA